MCGRLSCRARVETAEYDRTRMRFARRCLTYSRCDLHPSQIYSVIFLCRVGRGGRRGGWGAPCVKMWRGCGTMRTVLQQRKARSGSRRMLTQRALRPQRLRVTRTRTCLCLHHASYITTYHVLVFGTRKGAVHLSCDDSAELARRLLANCLYRTCVACAASGCCRLAPKRHAPPTAHPRPPGRTCIGEPPSSTPPGACA